MQSFGKRQALPRIRAKVLAIECYCRPEVAHARIAARLQQGMDASEATGAVFEQQRQVWEAWPSEIAQCRIDTELPLHKQVDQVIAKLASL